MKFVNGVRWFFGIGFAVSAFSIIRTSFVGALGAIGCAILLVPPVEQKVSEILKSKGADVFGNKLFKAGLFIVAIIVMFSNTPKTPPKMESVTPITTVTVSLTPTEISLDYEILSNEKNGTTRRIIVYTTESENNRLITLNDQLVNKYKSGLTHLTIEYFDDKAIAPTYFQKVADLNSTGVPADEKEADRLFSHYVAGMTLNTTTEFGDFNKQVNGDWVLLKKY